MSGLLFACISAPTEDVVTDSPAEGPADSHPPALFDLVVRGDSYPHIGQTVGMSVIRDDFGAVVAQDALLLSDNSIAFTFEGALAEGVAHTVDWYADNNESGTCDDGDHAWVEAIGAFTAHAEIVLDHVNGAPYDYDAACDTFSP